MPTSYTSNLRLALPANGELAGLWGSIVNDSITKMLEEAVAGRAAISSWAANSHTLTEANGATSESRCAVLDLSGALSAAGTLLVPDAITKLYVVRNNTTGGYAVTVQRVSGGAGVTVPNGRVVFLYTDGSNVRVANEQSAGDTAFTPAGTVEATNVQAAVEELDTDIQGKQPLDATLTALAGVTVAADKLIYATDADAFATTDLTEFARLLLDDADADTARATLGLGSMAVQPASGVSITGGSIAGIIDLAVADGGTGASTAAEARTNLDVPARDGTGAVGTWVIDISGQATSAGSALSAIKLSQSTGAAPSYAARAWGNFDGTGTTGTNQTVRGHGNIASVFKNGTGDYTVNFDAPMPNANYAVGLGFGDRGIGNIAAPHISYASRSTSSVRVYCSVFTGSTNTMVRADFDDCSISVFC